MYPVVEYGGPGASRSLERLLPVGTRVRLVSDPTRGTELEPGPGRILRYVVKISDGRDIEAGAAAVRRTATVFVWHHNPFKQVAQFTVDLLLG